MKITPDPTLVHTGRLALTPADPLQAVEQTTVLSTLRGLDLLGRERGDSAANAFAAGPALGELIGFTGCAVQFGGEASSAGAVAPWVRIPPPSEAPRLLWGRNTRPPRCPNCGASLRAWREQVPVAAGSDDKPASCDAALPLHCDACDTAAPALRWRWGRHGGAGRSLILVEEVFPGEGAPLPALVKALDALGAGPWSFFYIQD